MRIVFILGIMALVANSTTGCKKSDKTSNTTIDSLDIHREGGFVGFNDRFRITPAQVRRGRMVNETWVYDSVLSAAKHAEVKGLLTTIPQDMVSNNQQAIQNGNDITYYSIVSYKAGTAYTYHLNPEKINSRYAADISSAFTVLSTP